MDNNLDDKRYKQYEISNLQMVLRGIINFILSFLLSITLTGLSLLLVVEWSGFSRSSFDKNMSANHYYDFVKNDIYNEAETITLPTGLPNEVLNNVFTSFKISQDVSKYIDASLNGKLYTPDTAGISKELRMNIMNYLKKEGMQVSQEQQSNIDSYIASIEKMYMDTVKMPLISVFAKARGFYQKIFPIGLAVCALLIIICITMIIHLHLWIHRALRAITYSTLATGLMTSILPLYILNLGFYKRINLSPEYFYNFFTDYITNIFQAFVYFSVAWIVISVIIMTSIKMIKNSKTYHKRYRG